MTSEYAGSTDFAGAPSALIVGDDTGPLMPLVEGAGFRLLGAVTLDEAQDRLDRQAGMGLVLLRLSADTGDGLDRLLDRLAALRAACVVLLPATLIDPVAARLADARLIVDPQPSEIALALGLAIRAGDPSGVRESGADGDLPRLVALSEEVARLARKLAGQGPPVAVTTPAAPDEPVTAQQLRAVIRARRVRDQMFGADMFADPAWDMLLDLAAAAKEGRDVPVSSLCIAAAVPATTALRWIAALTDAGLFVRRPDPRDGRRVFVMLSDDAAARVDACVAAMRRAGAA